MEENLSGSQDPMKHLKNVFNRLDPEIMPYGIVMFHKDGTLSSLCAPSSFIGEDESATVSLALDFTRYAFDRPDWMLEYIRVLEKSLEEKYDNDKKPHLTLVKGGIDDVISDEKEPPV